MTKMAKKNKKGSRIKTEEKEFDLPQGLELLESNGWGQKFTKWFKDNFSAIILPIIALIILGGGIYLYSQQKNNSLQINPQDLQTSTTVNLDNQANEKETETAANSATEQKNQKEANVQTESKKISNNTSITIKAQGETSKKTESAAKPTNAVKALQKAYTETAQAGEGITHLARRALRQYLQSTNQGLTPEQKIYAEDYIQNHTGTQMLTIGEKITFSQNLIKDAISQAQKLTTAQLQNLKQYSQLVPSLNY